MALTRGAEAHVVGAGIAGTWAALLLAERGLAVTLHDRSSDGSGSASWWAGGMLAPDCESEVSEKLVTRLGRRSLDLWARHAPDASFAGSLVVSHPRDRADLDRFARQTSGHEPADAAKVAALEPILEGRFPRGLFFPAEGHVEPRRALPALRQRLKELGGAVRMGSEVAPEALGGAVVDCRGLAARSDAPELRGVKGETVLVETAEITLRRPVRLVHPRWPLYVIPRAGNRFLIGASSIESEDDSGVSVRSALELMTAAYTLHPAFGEARIVEIGAALRPAFPDNAPRIEVKDRIVSINGLYRHGFLLAPALAELAAGWLLDGTRDNEAMRWS